jgi:hypothetical protein
MVYMLDKIHWEQSLLLYLSQDMKIFFELDVKYYHHTFFIYIKLNFILHYLLFLKLNIGTFYSYKVVAS